MEKISVITKLSVKNVYGKVPKMNAGDADVSIMRVIGRCNGSEVKETAIGDSTRFIGDFLGECLSGNGAGKKYRAGSAYFPKVVGNMIEGALANNEGAVEFGFDIVARADETSATGYVYVCESLLQDSATDPLLILAKRVETLALPVATSDVAEMAESDESDIAPKTKVAKAK
jgi:hypothetical protein